MSIKQINKGAQARVLGPRSVHDLMAGTYIPEYLSEGQDAQALASAKAELAESAAKFSKRESAFQHQSHKDQFNF